MSSKVQSREKYQNFINLLRYNWTTLSILEKQIHRMNNAAMDSPKPSAHIFIIFLFCFQLEISSAEGMALLFQNLQSGWVTLCVQPAVLEWQKVGSYMQMYILEVPKLAQIVLKVYFFFQIQMWPWQCYFQNESWFQNLQFEDPKLLACKSVPGLWICMKPCPTPVEVPSQPCYALCWGAGQGHSLACHRRVGLLGTLGAFCHFLVSDGLISTNILQHFSLLKVWFFEHFYDFNNRLKLYSQSFKCFLWSPWQTLRCYIWTFCLNDSFQVLKSAVCTAGATCETTAESWLWCSLKKLYSCIEVQVLVYGFWKLCVPYLTNE